MTAADITGSGTSEATWSPWLDGQSWPVLDLSSIADRRVVALAAHPDDEVLGVGGLLARLADRGHEIVCAWATDGEASHPRSTRITPERLAQVRRVESERALARLGVDAQLFHFGFPDGDVPAHADELAAAVEELVRPDDLVLAPWSGDGHLDHEAVGRAAVATDATVWQYPVWMWHWARPADARVPWRALHGVALIDAQVKAEAIEEFDTQVRPLGPDSADAAILPPDILARFLRSAEWLFV